MGTVQFVLAMLLMASVDGTYDHKHPKCSKEWIRYLVLNACNYSKRHAAVVQYIIEESIYNMQLKFNEILRLSESRQPAIGKSRTKRTTQITAEQIRIEEEETKHKKNETGLTSFGSLLNDSDLIEEIQQDEELWTRRARSIKTLVERCCVRLCKEEDFKVLCFA